ncbi:aladin-like [Zingiber officinale]|uniref:aladin-like n=1 Tax=Zingiber officinale TaxID=94328 RepID=UPI001C4B9999|nr:aladin-like [Zingiber officinale]
MPSFPQPGVVTVCEINRDIITAESLSDELAKDTYGKILGVIFSPVPFQPEASNVEQVAGQEPSDAAPTGGFARLKEIVAGYTNRIFFPNEVRYSTMLNMLADIDTQRVSWHPKRHCLAFVSGQNQVTVKDYEHSDGKDPCFLTSEFQRDIKTLEWRPNSGMMLAVGCRGGICIWSASFPGNSASVRYEITSSVNSVSGGPGVRWILVDFLQSSNSELTSILSWSPNGRYLASSSYGSSSFTVWDVSQGVGTAIRRGLGPLSMLKWSPSGDYFLTAKLDGTFYLWETITWTSEPWSSTTGYVTGVAWDPEGRMILISFSESVTLGAIHFASKPPSLAAHLVPLEMPELASLSARGIEKMAWDASGERLALSFKDGDEMYNGLIAIYDTRTTPLVSASLVGFIRGPGEKPKPLAFAFHKFKQGPILSVCWSSGWCCTYPLIIRSHILL